MSRQKSSKPTGIVFLNSVQAVELLHKNPCRYDELASGGLLGGFNTYAYVAGNSISFADPEGLYRTQNGHYTPFPPRPRVPNPSPSRPSYNPDNPWPEAAGYYNDEGAFKCFRWNCPKDNASCSAADTKRSNDFLPSATDPTNAPAGCTCDAPAFGLNGQPGLKGPEDYLDAARRGYDRFLRK